MHGNIRLELNNLTDREREALVESCTGLARYWANRYCRGNYGIYDDLLGAAFEGLVLASQRYQPSYGYKFTTYATPWIQQKILRYLFVENRHGFKGLRDAKPRKVQRSRSHKGRKELPELHEVQADHRTNGCASADTMEIWDELLRRLTDRERFLIELRYREGLTLFETGEVLGITRERVRQLELKAIDKLRKSAKRLLTDATGYEVPLPTNLIDSMSDER